MAARILKFLVLLGLIVAACAGRSHQQSHGEHASSQSPATVVQPQGHYDAVLLSSLATFVTSGVGYAYISTPRQLQLRQQGFAARSLNSSGGAKASNSSTGHNANFDPTPPHKPLWPNWSTQDVWLFVLSAVTLFIAAGGGIGGGAVFVPLFIIVGGFTAAQAVALSNITILGGAVANFIANSRKRHAFRDTPLIDWDLIMVMEPTTMLGALLGSYNNKVGKSMGAVRPRSWGYAGQSEQGVKDEGLCGLAAQYILGWQRAHDAARGPQAEKPVRMLRAQHTHPCCDDARSLTPVYCQRASPKRVYVRAAS